MTRLQKRQAFICVLISLLICGLIWYDLLPAAGEPNQVKAFSFDSFEESPLRDRESRPAPSLLWQVDQGYIAFLQNVAVVRSNKAPIKSPSNVRSGLCYYRHNIDSGHTGSLLRTIYSPNTVFKFINGQTYQYLDIPPPHV